MTHPVRSGGGIANYNHLTVTNSTISGNESCKIGGGILSDTATITDSTIWGNRQYCMSFSGIDQAGGIAQMAVFSVGATIVAGNTGDFEYHNVSANCLASLTSVGYNLTDDPSTANSCVLTASTDVIGANPQLGAG